MGRSTSRPIKDDIRCSISRTFYSPLSSTICCPISCIFVRIVEVEHGLFSSLYLVVWIYILHLAQDLILFADLLRTSISYFYRYVVRIYRYVFVLSCIS